MNRDHPFDALATAFASGLSRREILGRAGQGLVGAMVAAWSLGGARGLRRRVKRRRLEA